jgi:hypothetical protein
MENKYYTPDIEDIHVGYKCEILRYKEWCDYTIGIEDFETLDFDLFIRTKYIDKKDIESEGWRFVNTGTEHFHRFDKIVNHREVKRLIEIKYDYETKILKVGFDCGNFFDCMLFDGNCPSINEFKLIIKLLGI